MNLPNKIDPVQTPSISKATHAPNIESKSGSQNDILWIVVGIVIVVSVVVIININSKTATLDQKEEN